MSININCDDLEQLLFIMDTKRIYIHIKEIEEIKKFTSMIKEYASEYYFPMADTWSRDFKLRDNCIGVNPVNHMISIRDNKEMPSDITIIEYNELFDFMNKLYNLSIDIMDMV